MKAWGRHRHTRTPVVVLAIVAVCLCWPVSRVEAGSASLSGEGPLLPRASGPRSSRTLTPPAVAAPGSVGSDVFEAAPSDDEREGTVPAESTSALRTFFDEMLGEGAILPLLPSHMAVGARRRFLDDRAIRSYSEAIRRYPDSAFVPGAHLRIATIYERRGEREAALRQYAALLKRFPHDELAGTARLARAGLLAEAGDFAAARDECYLLIDGIPGSRLVADAYLTAARAHESLGDLDDAALAYEHVLRRVVSGDDRYVMASEGLARLDLARGDSAGAIAIYEQLFEDAPTQTARDTRQFKFASMCLDAGATARGRRELRKIVHSYALNVYRERAAYLLADSYYAEGKMPQAIDSYTAALRDFPTYEGRITALFAAADAYRELLLYDEALAMVRQVLPSRTPASSPHERARAKLVSGHLLLLNEEYGAALEALYGAVLDGRLTQPEQHEAAYRIAESYYRGGYYNEALDAFESALAQAPEHPLAFAAALDVAACYEKKGWLDEARQRYMAVIEGASEADTPEQLAGRSAAVFRLLETYGGRGLYQEELDCARKLHERDYAFLDKARLLYAIACGYENLNNPYQARQEYERVRSEYPASTWAQQAAVKIRQMKMLEGLKKLSGTQRSWRDVSDAGNTASNAS